MSNVISDEILKQSAEITIEERRELIHLLQEQQIEKQAEERAKKPKVEINKDYVVDLNTQWLKKNRQKYQGLHVALKDGELIATGKTIKEVDLSARAKGIEKFLLTYVFPLDSKPFGGW